jgi:GTPase involved in cell partitioning and DNA repair
LPEDPDLHAIIESIETAAGEKALLISAVTRQGLEDLMNIVWRKLDEMVIAEAEAEAQINRKLTLQAIPQERVAESIASPP